MDKNKSGLMPGMDGISLVRTLKENHFTSHIPIVFLTSKVAMDDHIAGFGQGIEAYIAKPFHPRYLRAVVDRIVSQLRCCVPPAPPCRK